AHRDRRELLNAEIRHYELEAVWQVQGDAVSGHHTEPHESAGHSTRALIQFGVGHRATFEADGGSRGILCAPVLDVPRDVHGSQPNPSAPSTRPAPVRSSLILATASSRACSSSLFTNAHWSDGARPSTDRTVSYKCRVAVAN